MSINLLIHDTFRVRWVLKYDFVTNFLLNLTVKEF